MTIHQTGPTEALAILKRLVASLAYKPGWKFMILDMDRGQGCAGTTLARHGYDYEVSTIDGHDLTPRHIIATHQRGGP